MMGFLLASHCVRPQIDRYCKVQGCEVRISFLRLNLFILLLLVVFFLNSRTVKVDVYDWDRDGRYYIFHWPLVEFDPDFFFLFSTITCCCFNITSLLVEHFFQPLSFPPDVISVWLLLHFLLRSRVKVFSTFTSPFPNCQTVVCSSSR